MGITTTALAKSQRSVQFLSTASWVCPPDVTNVEVLLVGGGGGGGHRNDLATISGGGGGGGAYMETSFDVVPFTSYTVTIGAGGSSSIGTTGSIGSSTSFGSLKTSLGGGGGAGPSPAQLKCSSTGGNAGTNFGGGGGGAVFTVPSSTNPIIYAFEKNSAYGFPGFTSALSVVPTLGINGFSGGGSGGSNNSSLASDSRHGGGIGAIAAGGTGTPAVAALVNTGGGGGGGTRASSVDYAPSAGGSGYAIIKYWSAF